MRKLRERYSDALGYEVSDEQFKTAEAGIWPLRIGDPNMPRPEGMRTFQRFHQPEGFVEQNHGLFELFGRRAVEGKLLMMTNMSYWGVPGEDFFYWIEVDGRVFSRILDWSRGGELWSALPLSLCDPKVENGFHLREGTNWGMDPEYKGRWTFEVFGEDWVRVAEEVFDF